MPELPPLTHVVLAARDLSTIEHGGIKHASYGSGIGFRDPDGIALELFAPPG